ncbi:HTH_48 domain-containing protein [Trichonephila inaurata madagascariensis]|uniref:HTH_48 domain-containing protein n=1 Tax=Trichonephila inaurata madagascariensis TaxID=2747483 RepID=A0A8X6XB37_9ARAC|nr:HTH_48 domain-containing protein [Trichonephila inaurata madagascariensis]
MNSWDFRELFLYQWKGDHNAATTVWNINTSFGSSSVNEHIILRWYAKFESGDESLSNEERDRPETVVNSEILRKVVEQNPISTVRDYSEELVVTTRTISHPLKIIGIVEKWIKWIPRELYENQKSKGFGTYSAIHLGNSKYPFLDRIVR